MRLSVIGYTTYSELESSYGKHALLALLVILGAAKPSLRIPGFNIGPKCWRMAIDDIGITTHKRSFGKIFT